MEAKTIEIDFSLQEPYVKKAYPDRGKIFCNKLLPAEEIACLAHDSAMALMGSSWGKNQTRVKMAVAIEALQLISNQVSSARASLYQTFLGSNSLVPTKKALKQKQGICGNHQEIFAEVMNILGFKTRKISIYYSADRIRLNHAATEVFIGDKWRFFDITWMSVWVESVGNIESIISYEELRQKEPIFFHENRISNNLSSWFMVNSVLDIPPFLYLNADHYFLELIGKYGTLNIDLTGSEEKFANIPNHIGSAETGETIDLLITLPEDKKHTLLVFVNTIRNSGKNRMSILVNSEKIELSEGLNEIKTNSAKTKVSALGINNRGDLYATLKFIQLK